MDKAISDDTDFDPGAIRDAYDNNLLVKNYGLSAGDDHACWMRPDGIICWGANTAGQSTVPALVNPKAVAAGGAFTCAIDQANVVCWGSNDVGQTSVPVLSNPTQITAGHSHACALDDSGVHCWGDNSQGQTTVPALLNPRMISAGGQHACALAEGGVHCWGNNSDGQATAPDMIYTPITLSAGYAHTCAMNAYGGVTCWGSNTNGQSDVPSNTTRLTVSAGKRNTCVVEDYSIVCWGNNTQQQLAIPVMPSSPIIATGNDYVCALGLDGVKCWGLNNAGQTNVPATTFDPDGDGLTYDQEVANSSDPLKRDTDDDKLDDNVDPFPQNPWLLHQVVGDKSKSHAGASVAFANDVNDDGYGDFVVGQPNYEVPAVGKVKRIKKAGRAQVISGKDSSVLFTTTGSHPGLALGVAVAGNADLDGDGHPDVVIGIPSMDDTINGITGAGAVRVIYGPDGTRSQDIFGTEAGAAFGAALAMADVDGDGTPDIVVGAPKANDTLHGIKHSGCAVVLSGQGFGVLMKVCGTAPDAQAGSAVGATTFDTVEGAEVVVGAPHDNDNLLKRADVGSVKIYSFSNPTAPIAVQYGSVPHEAMGTTITSADVDKDGHGDVVMGAPNADDTVNHVNGAGSVSVLYGPDASRSLHLLGGEPGDHVGYAVAATDMDGDGVVDIVGGAPMRRETGSTRRNVGTLFVWNDMGSGSYYFINCGIAVTNNKCGAALSSGDINNDGKDDLIVSTPGHTASDHPFGKKAGAVRVYSGGAEFD